MGLDLRCDLPAAPRASLQNGDSGAACLSLSLSLSLSGIIRVILQQKLHGKERKCLTSL